MTASVSDGLLIPRILHAPLFVGPDFEDDEWIEVTPSSDLNALVNCDIVHNVCPAPDKKLFPKGINTEWCKPGRSLWQW